MRDYIRRALTRRISVKRGRTQQIIEIPPSETLLFAMKFAMGMLICLSALEIAHMAFLGTWSNEIFSMITGLIGTVVGVLISQHA